MVKSQHSNSLENEDKGRRNRKPMDIDVILDPKTEIVEFTGSSVAGPSGQEPQVEPFVHKLFSKPLRREKPNSSFEVHGMKNLQPPDLEDDEIPESVFDNIQDGSLVKFGKSIAIIHELSFDYENSKVTVGFEANGKNIKRTIRLSTDE